MLRDRPDLSRERLLQVRDAMDEHAADCRVTGYDALIEGLELPDPNDRHVLAVAIVGHADVIVTHNLRHFPAALLERYGIAGARRRRRPRPAGRPDPAAAMAELLALFERLGLSETVAELRHVMGL